MLNQIAQFIASHQHFVVTSHSRPDGDSIGSSLALGQALIQAGKEVRILQADPPPHAYSRLPGVELVEVTDRIEHDCDAVIILECNSLERPGLEGMEGRLTINIDHHAEEGRFADLNWVDPSRAAVGEMVYELIQTLGIAVQPAIAANLFVALTTDTGSFQFANTNERTFRIAAELAAAGANPGKLAQMVYLSQPLAKVKLLARVLDSLEVHPNQKIAWIHMSQADLQKTGAKSSDTEGIVTHPLSIDGVCVAAFFRQQSNGEYRVSLRSKGDYDVAAVARQFGGGGHTNASGMSAKGSFREVQGCTIGVLEKLFE